MWCAGNWAMYQFQWGLGDVLRVQIHHFFQDAEKLEQQPTMEAGAVCLSNREVDIKRKTMRV